MNNSDFNLQRINTEELAGNIAATIEFGGNLLAIAKRGTGKTTIAQQVIKNCNHREVYMNLSLYERPDIGGYPNFWGAKNGEKFINFLLPSIYQPLVEGDQPCVALLDEVDKADDSILAPLLEFVHKRSINGFELKNLKAIIMTGNLPGESGRRPPLPLLDRTEKFLVEINPKHWLEWGAQTGEIHPSISAFIADNLDELSGEINVGDMYGDKSPRAWHMSSRIVKHGEKHGWDRRMIMHKVAGCVGKKAGTKYRSFFEFYQEVLPIVNDVLVGKQVNGFSNLEPTKKLITCMILCSRFAKELDEFKEQILSKNSNVSEFVLNSDLETMGIRIAKFLETVDVEMALISLRGQLGMKRALEFGLTEDKYWGKILDKIINQLKSITHG